MTMSTPPIPDRHSASDDELIMAVRDALRAYDPVRMWGDAVQVDAQNGNVLLAGSVRSRSAKEEAERLVYQVDGVKGVENNFRVDNELEVLVAQALAADPRTQSAQILVGVVFGLCYLKGTVDTSEIKAAAGEIASKVPGIHAVSNELTALTQATPAAKPATPKPAAAAA